jgi:hypothetical protein
VADGEITAAKLAADAVNSSIVANNTLTADDLAAGSVGTSELNTASGPTTSGQVLSYDGSGLAWDTPSATVTSDGTTITGDGSSGSPLAILDGAVTADEIAADAVTADKVAAGAVTSGALANGAVGTDALADASIAAADLNVAGTPSNGDVLTYDDTEAGRLFWEPSGTFTSSIRFKTDVETITNPLSLVEQLRGVRYHWTSDGRADVGLIAEEVATVLPELVTYEADGTTIRGLRYAPLVGVLVEANKAQQAALDAATETIATQQKEIEALSDRLARLEALVQSLHEATDASAQ